MEKRLIEAANAGDVDKLHNLINDNPILLRAVALTGGDNPLHIACMGGHVRFVEEVLKLRPQFTNELNQEGLSPLHIASANGDIEIVKELLKLDSHICLVQGNENMIPFHCAVVKGRIEVIKELLSVCQDSISEVTARGETCFHLAVKNNQFKALKVLCEHVIMFDREDILNHKDEQGNTILHLATSRKQYQVVDLLLDKNFGYKGNLEVNSLNKKGLTPLDVLVSKGGDSGIEEMLTLAISPQNSVVPNQGPSQNQTEQEQRRVRPPSAHQSLLNFFKYDRVRDSPSDARNTLLVIAALVATATFSVALNPPGGVWQEDFWPDVNSTSKNSSTEQQPPPHKAGTAVLATRSPIAYGSFLLFNSLGFFTSMYMTSVLTTGFPLHFELQVAFFALGATYGSGLEAITPTKIFLPILSILLFVSIMMSILPIAVRNCKKRQRSELPITGASA